MRTNDYGIFKQIQGNRKVNDRHVTRLKEAVERKNLLPYFPILVNENMEIIDGQHRLTAAVQLGYDIYYEKVPGLRIEDVMQINTNSKSWGIRDFIDSWIVLEKPDYQQLKSFMEEYDMTPTISAQLLQGYTYVLGGSHTSDVIRSGDFKVQALHWAEGIASQLKTLKKYSETGVSSDREFIQAIVKLSKNETFDFERLISKIKLHSLTIERRQSEKYYIIHIEELYNFNAKVYVELYKSTYEYTKTKPR